SPLLLFPGERLRGRASALVLGEQLDPALGVVQIFCALARERHTFLEDLERFLERQVAGLERGHDLLEPSKAILKLEVAHRAPSCRSPAHRAGPGATSRRRRRRWPPDPRCARSRRTRSA